MTPASHSVKKEKSPAKPPTARRRALLSVSDKSGVADLARRLHASGWELLASGGTGRALEEAEIPFVPVESVTGNAEAFDGRMKTISFQLESAILFDRDNPRHVQEAKDLGLVPIDLVVCNFYPFSQAVSSRDCTLQQAVEQIDVGGPTMVRAAAKNFGNVAVVVDPADYKTVLTEIERDGFVSASTRQHLATRAFHLLALSDFEVAYYLEYGHSGGRGHAPLASQLPFSQLLMLHEGRPLRYGENPHQAGYYFRVDDGSDDPLSLHRFTHHQGKPLSYNNLLDADGALYALCLLGAAQPAAVVVKHTNPCGAAYGQFLSEAFERAWAGDPLAAFGGVVAVNRPLAVEVARQLVADRFVEVVLAPMVSADALAVLAARKNMRVLTNPALLKAAPPQGMEFRTVRGGMLMQNADSAPLSSDDLEYPTGQRPTDTQLADLLLAWRVCCASRSNAVTVVKDGMLVGSGVGQQDRLRSCRIAVEKAGERAAGAAAASDAFFPFADGPQVLAQAGVTAIIQPGGSVRDQDTIDLCNQLGVAMVTTRGRRCFRH